MDLYKIVEDKLTNIHDELCLYIEQENYESGKLGLLDGLSGIALFFTEHYKLTGNEKSKENIDKIIRIILKSISSNGVIDSTFCSGLSGIGWLFEYLELSQIEQMKPIMASFDNRILQFSTCQFLLKNYDLISGGLGGGMYFLRKKMNNSQITEGQICQIIENLEKISTETDNLLFWCKYKNQNRIDLGMAHGLTSILSYLNKVSTYSSILNERISKIVYSFRNFSQKYDEIGSFWSYDINVELTENVPIKSRLAWCYGDISTALTILSSSKLNKLHSFELFAIEVLDKNILRVNLEENGIFDATICHGASGIALIYKKAFHLTGFDRYKKCADYWLLKIIDFSEKGTDKSGFDFFNGEFYSHELSLLEGIAGIGLVMCSFLAETSTLWEEVLLL